MRRFLVAVVSLLAFAGTGTAAAAPSASPACSGIVVLVQASPSASDVRCSPETESGSAALTAAGFQLTRQGSMICRINAVPSTCAITPKAYWSYWHATATPSGWTEWSYSTLGADAFDPKAGDLEGWTFGDGQPPALTPAEAARATSGGNPPSGSGNASTSAGSQTTGPLATLAVLAGLAGAFMIAKRSRGRAS